MKKNYGWLTVALLTTACAVNPPPTPPPTPPAPPSTVAFDVVACATWPPVDNYCPGPAGAVFKLDTTTGKLVQTGDGDGYAYYSAAPPMPTTFLTIDVAGFDHFDSGTISTASLVAANIAGKHNFFQLHSSHVDPSNVPLEQLAAIRGSMWPTRINVPYGPRPNQDSNILATDFYGLYDAPTQTRMLDVYQGRGYTHAVAGPVAGSDCYHGLYPCRTELPTQAQWDAFLDDMQAWWDRGLVPVYFHKPDGWETPDHAADLDALDALAAQPRAQKLLRVVVYCGWEPSGSKYGWPNFTYVNCLARGARVFPNALRALHTVSDLDAPTGGDDDHRFPPGQGNAISWTNAAPYIHVWFVQVGGYVGGCCEVPTADFVSEFKKIWPDFRNKFNGANGWPNFSAWGPGKPIRAIYAEGASYGDFWKNWAEQYALDLGDIAMQAGAWGYLDGGRVPVPVQR